MNSLQCTMYKNPLKNLLSPKIYRGVFPSLIFLFFACEIPTEVYDNPLDVENDVFDTPAMVFFPDTVTVNVGGSVTLNVFAMEITNLSGSHIQVNYNKNKLQLLSVNEGEFFSGADNLIFIFENDPTTGTIDIYTSFLGGDTISVSGTGSLANLVLTATSSGMSSVTYTGACEFADPDDNPIEIKGFGEGVVNAQ